MLCMYECNLERFTQSSVRRIALFKHVHAVISIGVSDIGVATTGNKNAVFVMLVDPIMLTSQSLKCLDLKI